MTSVRRGSLPALDFLPQKLILGLLAVVTATLAGCSTLPTPSLPILGKENSEREAGEIPREFERKLPDSFIIHESIPSDTLWSVARKYNPMVRDREELLYLVSEIRRINSLDSDLIPLNSTLTVPTSLQLPAYVSSTQPKSMGEYSDDELQRQIDALLKLQSERQNFSRLQEPADDYSGALSRFLDR